MNPRDPKLIVLQFNEHINNRDIRALAEMMAEDYVFIDATNRVHEGGKEVMVREWNDFFNLYPDYRNDFILLESQGNRVQVIGSSSCSHGPLHGPAIWTARVTAGRIAEWRVYLDTPENRRQLGLPEARCR